MKKVLLITDVDFWLGGAGHRVRISSLVDFLDARTELDILFVGKSDINLANEKMKTIHGHFWTLPFEENRDITENAFHLAEMFNKTSFDTIIVEYIHNTYFLKYFEIGDAKLILDAHDIISERSEEFQKFNYGGLVYEMSKDFEYQIFDIYDHILVLCTPDMQKINSFFDRPRALLCPHPSNIFFHPMAEKVKTIGFVASEYPPNIDGLMYFIETVWSQIIGRYDTQLTIYGNICQRLNFQTNPNIILKGFVENVQEAYQEIDVIINPVRFGAGLKIKNIEALANCLPLITTKHGARGLELAQNDAFLVAESPRDFVTHLSNLIDNTELRRHLSANARKFVLDNYSTEKCFEPLMSVL